MIKAYRYKLKPTYKQQKILAQDFGNVRFIYNWALGLKKDKWENEKISLSYYDLAKMMTELKNDGEHEWLNNTSSVSLQQTLRHLDAAYTKFFKEKKGFPKFKSKKNPCNSIQFTKCMIDFKNHRITVGKTRRLGTIKFCKNREFDVDKVKIGTTTISKDSLNNYWISIIVDDYSNPKEKAHIKDDDTCVGIDMGVKNLCILDNGIKYDNPKYYKKSLERLAILQRRLSLKTKGSKNYERLRLQVAKLNRKIANQRLDYLHKTTTEIVDKYDTICLETLNVKGMQKNHSLAQAIGDTSLGMFNGMLSYKGNWKGKNIIHIGRFEPSSKTCNKCGYVNKDLTLGDREWTCPICGEHHDRDINAAINIRKIGLAIVS